MKTLLRNREPRPAIIVGAGVAVAAGLALAAEVILGLGGGSFTRGWGPGKGYLGFYGIFMLPVLAVVWLAAVILSRALGAGLVAIGSTVLLGAYLTHTVLTSSPGAQLSRVTGRSGLPKLEFERFERNPSFNDGTAFLWVARCSSEEATRLASALGLERIPTLVRWDHPKFPMMEEHSAVADYRAIFEGDIEGVEFYVEPRGMIAGYSPVEQRFRLYWWPPIVRENN